jgi:hypothetical protein
VWQLAALTGGLAEAGLEAGGATLRSHRARCDFLMGDGPGRLALAEAGLQEATTVAVQRRRGRGSSTQELGNEATTIF